MIELEAKTGVIQRDLGKPQKMTRPLWAIKEKSFFFNFLNAQKKSSMAIKLEGALMTWPLVEELFLRLTL